MSKEPDPTPVPTPALSLERVVTMKAAPTTTGVEHAKRALVPGALWQVHCNDCGAHFDSAAPSAEAALSEVRADHDPAHTHLSVQAVDYGGHPLR